MSEGARQNEIVNLELNETHYSFFNIIIKI